MELKNGRKLKGEEDINHNFDIERVGIKKNYLFPRAKANKKAIERIIHADIIIIGPGNHYCSIIPNLLVDGICEAIKKSKAKVIFNCNLTNKKGQTEYFDLDKYISEMNRYIGKNRIDFVTFNTKKPSSDLIKKYEKQEGKNMIVKFDENCNRGRKSKIIKADMLDRKKIKQNNSDPISNNRSFIRHDGEKLAKVSMNIIESRV